MVMMILKGIGGVFCALMALFNTFVIYDITYDLLKQVMRNFVGSKCLISVGDYITAYVICIVLAALGYWAAYRIFF